MTGCVLANKYILHLGVPEHECVDTVTGLSNKVMSFEVVAGDDFKIRPINVADREAAWPISPP
jgi:hypothetical protein